MKICEIQVGLLATNCYLVYNEADNSGFVIDPGAEADQISGLIERMEVKPQAILLTHGHYDHIAAAEELRSRYNIPVMAASVEENVLSDVNLNLSLPMFRDSVSLKADKLLTNGQLLQFGDICIKCLLTPGHTCGSMSYYVESEKTIFSGDVLFKENIGRTDFPTGNPGELLYSVNSIIGKLPEDTRVFVGHGEETTVGYEKKHNYYMSE